MKRQEFIKKSALAGLGLPLLSLLSSCKEDNILPNEIDTNFSGNVLIIGAGAAGLMAGHFLDQYGIDFQILEASLVYGGRVKRADTFADFPIDLGAEWIHTDPSILADLVNDPGVQASIDIINYRPEEIYVWKNDELKKRNFFSNFYAEHKFKNTTWFGFLENYIVPGIADRIIYDSPVAAIDHSGNRTMVTAGSATYEADRVILTVPLTILQNDSIAFTPALPAAKQTALGKVDMPSGLKVFLEFSERFYPDMILDGGLLEQQDIYGEKALYDAAFRKDSNQNIFGLFAVGDPAKEYTDQGDNDAIVAYLIDELDQMFDGKASRFYQKHVIQNWLAEPYILGSYSHYEDNNREQTMRDLRQPLENKVYFAGEAYHDDWQSTVHGAGLSAYDAVREILRNA